MPGSLRLIGGRWRGRRLAIPVLPGLRPTPDRVRETLFNWLGPRVEGARCLDLFAGTGALGFEAASRGAAQVVMVEQTSRAVAHLRSHASALLADAVEVVNGEALSWLGGRLRPFDIVFLDPPFERGLVGEACRLLSARAWLAPGARIYVETELDTGDMWLPQAWSVLRRRRAGQVRYYLASSDD